MSRRSETIRPLIALALGSLVLAAGVELARRWLPEWYGHLPETSFFVQRYRELTGRVGFRPGPGEPWTALVEASRPRRQRNEELDKVGPAQAAATGAGGQIRVRQEGTLPGDDRTFGLALYFSPQGVVQWLVLDPSDSGRVARKAETGVPPDRRDAFARLLLAPGESLGERREGNIPGETEVVYALVGSDPPWHLRVEIERDGSISASRRAGGIEPAADGEDDSDFPVLEILLIAVPLIAGVLIALGLFLTLFGRRRIDLVDGIALAVLSLAAALPALFPAQSGEHLAETLLPAFFLALWVLMLWSAGESYLRSVQPGLAVNLDALRAGRLGPRTGRALLYGLALGAALAGLHLGILAVAAARPGAWPDGPSIELPIFGAENPFWAGVQIAGAVALALALALRFLPARWALLGACLAAGLAIPLVGLHPLWARVAADFAIVTPLVVLCRRQGLAATLSAALALFLLPAAVFSGLRLEWLLLPFTLAAGSLLALLGLGLVGLARPAQGETERLKPPPFIRRLEEERRLRYEMDLLARMQLGLLPANLPEVPGWEIAARSLLATEAGGDLYDVLSDEEGNLWIAAGDVAGHGYSCAIAQAMTVAALTSLITAGRKPSEVLQGVDRVIRRSGAHRHFTSLVLVRLDPRTGEGLMSNAGHPFPLLLAVGSAVEEINLPGLPLGRGPHRLYADRPFRVPPRGALVFCSDGLFEATDGQEAPYGYDRPRELLRSLDEQSAGQILETLFADWRRHIGSNEPPPDDTTVVVVKRVEEARPAAIPA